MKWAGELVMYVSMQHYYIYPVLKTLYQTVWNVAEQCLYHALIDTVSHLNIKGIDIILNQFNKPDIEIIICGDINIKCLDENCYKQQQDALLATYNLISTVQFQTGSLNGSISAIDYIFIDKSHKGKYTLS